MTTRTPATPRATAEAGRLTFHTRHLTVAEPTAAGGTVLGIDVTMRWATYRRLLRALDGAGLLLAGQALVRGRASAVPTAAATALVTSPVAWGLRGYAGVAAAWAHPDVCVAPRRANVLSSRQVRGRRHKVVLEVTAPVVVTEVADGAVVYLEAPLDRAARRRVLRALVLAGVISPVALRR